MSRILVIGDVGVTDDIIHIGDEAMFEALITELRSRGVDGFVGVSSNPPETAARYGIEAVHRLFEPGTRDELAERMSRVLAAATGEASALAPGDRAWAVIREIENSDGVAIAGGGNLASTWPMHIYERATLGALARRAGVPLVITGQTFGPWLTPEDEELVARLVGSAELVGVREGASLELARGWGRLDAVRNIDDASFLGNSATEGSYCLVTISTHLGGADPEVVVTRLAELLSAVGVEPVFLAHYGSTNPDVVMGDSVLHERLRALAGGKVIIPSTARAAAADARGASLIVTSRYHPAVFGTAAGVPVIGIPVDDYTTVKLTGALEGRGMLPMARLLAGDPAPVVARRPAADRTGYDAWWDRIAATFG